MSKKRPPMHSGGIKQAKNHKEMPCFLPKITIFVPDHTDRNMKKSNYNNIFDRSFRA